MDSGASVNVVSHHFIKKGEKLNRTNIVLNTAGGKTLEVLGEKEMHIQMGGNVGKVKMYVVRGLVQQCILGIDGLQALNISLSFGNDNQALSGNRTLELAELSVDVGDLTSDQERELRKLVDENKDLFEKIVPGSAKDVEHRVQLTTDEPVVRRPYRMPLTKQKIVENEVDKMLNDGVIRESTSPFCAPVVLAKKKDGTQRFCVDYRELNKVTKKDKFPIPRIDDLLDKVKGAKVFSSLDLASGYWQVKMREEDKEKTAFGTSHGHYEFNVMPFGLTNAPATFQRLMNRVAGRIKSVIVYIDDLLIFSESWKDHMDTLREIFKALREFGLKLKADKCRFGCEEIRFLGFIIDSEGCKTDPDKIQSIKSFPLPRTQTELRRFLGLANYYRKFIKDFASTAAPLYELTGKKSSWQWSREQQQAFEKLKEKLMKPPVLASPDISLPYKIYTDASGTGMGAVLSQEQNGNDRVIAFASQHFTKREKKYSTIEKEAAAVLWACKKFHPYIVGARFQILSDHAPLKWLFAKQGASGRIGRWQAHLLEFEGLEGIEYLRGLDNGPADALSRIPEILSIGTDDFKSKQENDPDFQLCRASLEKEDVWKHGGRIFIPKNMRQQVIQEFHGQGVHFGIRRTLDLIQQFFFWPSMRKEIQLFVNECDICKRAKWSEKVNSVPPKPIASTDYPFKRIYMDYAGPFRQSVRGNKYFLVVVDDFSRFLKIYPVRDCSAATTIRCLQDVILNEGCPREIMTDNGTHFTSHLVKQLLDASKIKHIRTAPYNPCSNGMAERNVRTVKSMIKSDLIERMGTSGTWDENLSRIQATYNASTHAMTGHSPFSLARGRTCTPVWFPVPVKVNQVKTSWNSVWRISKKRREDGCKRKEKYHKKEEIFHEGDWVWRKKMEGWYKTRISKKLHHGAYELIDGSKCHSKFLIKSAP